MKIEKLVAIYVIVLGLVACACAQFPSVMSNFVNVFFPSKNDLGAIWFIRYRMALYISATLIFLCLIPYLAVVGFHSTNIRRVMRFSWTRAVFLVVIYPVMWAVFPPIGLCAKCWASNDYFYFFIIFGLFIGGQIFFQVFLVKVGVSLWRLKRVVKTTIFFTSHKNKADMKF